MAVLAAVSDFF